MASERSPPSYHGGDPSCVPPDFNHGMQAIWEDLWHAMPQSGRVGTTVHTMLQRYRERCQAARKRPRESSQSPPAALLPVSFSLAKDWLLRQQRAQSEPLESGAVNEEAREVVTDINRSLDEQSTSTAALLEQPARPASPVHPLRKKKETLTQKKDRKIQSLRTPTPSRRRTPSGTRQPPQRVNGPPNYRQPRVNGPHQS